MVLLNEAREPQNTWYGGNLVVEGRRATPALEKALSNRYRYPEQAYRTVTLQPSRSLVPDLPMAPVRANIITLDGANIPTKHEAIVLAPAESWPSLFARENIYFLTIVASHSETGDLAHG